MYGNKPVAQSPILRYGRQPIYDRKQVAASASQTLNFFKDFATGYTKLTSNLNTGGRLGNQEYFFCDGISIHTECGVSSANLSKLLDYSFIELKISGLEVLVAPLFMLPDCGGLKGGVSTTASDTTVQAWKNGELPYFPLTLPDASGKPKMIEISEEENIDCTVNMVAGGAPSAAFYLWVFLHGVKGRK